MVDEKVRRAGCMSSNADGLDRWFARAQRGEPTALDGLLRAVFPTAQRFAARSCSSREDAEDAVQDALTALARRVGALRAAETVTSWLFVTIRHACQRRVPGVTLVPLDAIPEAARPDIASAMVSTARRLGISVRAANSRLHRARRALAASISEPTIRKSA